MPPKTTKVLDRHLMDAQYPLKTTISYWKMLMVACASANMLKSYDIIIFLSLLLNYFIILCDT